jgi:hypothetical protein
MAEGAGAHDAHIILRLHVGALRQQRLDHLQVAALRGEVERRLSILRRRRASGSAPPSAILKRPPPPPESACAAAAASTRSRHRTVSRARASDGALQPAVPL